MATTRSEKSHRKRKADHYDDPSYNYQKYWRGREYEHLAEEIALRRLLRGKHFKTAVDVGGGYGRLSIVLADYADEVVLAEPSQQQLDIAKDFLQGYPRIKAQQMQAAELKFKNESVDLVVMVRVMHHLPNPTPELEEIARVLQPGGLAIIEVANYLHIRNRVKHLLKGQGMPVKPVDIRSEANRRADEVPFVNHNPHTVVRQMDHAGLQLVATLSVSNLRSVRLKKIMPKEIMLGAERALQRPLATVLFGPSIFMLVQKAQ